MAHVRWPSRDQNCYRRARAHEIHIGGCVLRMGGLGQEARRSQVWFHCQTVNQRFLAGGIITYANTTTLDLTLSRQTGSRSNRQQEYDIIVLANVHRANTAFRHFMEIFEMIRCGHINSDNLQL